jgi:hypothetical protein
MTEDAQFGAVIEIRGVRGDGPRVWRSVTPAFAPRIMRWSYGWQARLRFTDACAVERRRAGQASFAIVSTRRPHFVPTISSSFVASDSQFELP